MALQWRPRRQKKTNPLRVSKKKTAEDGSAMAEGPAEDGSAM